MASSVQIDLLPLAAQTASGAGPTTDVSGIKELAVFAHVTTGSGSLSGGHFALWMESSDDGGVTWYDIAPDYRIVDNDTYTDPVPVLGVVRNIIPDTTTIITADSKWTAVYTRFGNKVRPRWILSGGSSPSETFSVKGVGKT